MKVHVWMILLLLALCVSCGPGPQSQSQSSPQASGAAGFRDKLATADQFSLQMTGVAKAPSGQVYQGWLLAEDGSATSVGTLTPADDGSIKFDWNAPNSENLLNRYNRFQVTLEPNASSVKPTGKTIFAGGFEAGALTKMRRLFVRNAGQPIAGTATASPTNCKDPYGCEPTASGTPLGTAFALGLKAQTELAAHHVQNAVNAAAIGSVQELHLHLEHVINILEGTNGPRFGDYDGDGLKQNPGDGFGVLSYMRETSDLIGNADATRDLLNDVRAQITAIEDKCIVLVKVNDTAAASAILKDLKAMSDKLKNESIARLYQLAQDTLTFPVTPVKS